MENQSPPHVMLLETTLRDGGYEIDHQLTADDTAFLTGALDAAGFRYIEVCHGNGVGIADWAPPQRGKLAPAAADAEHLEAARATASRSKYGVLTVCGPEFSKIGIVDRMVDYGVGFLRLGLPPDVFLDHSFWLPYVERIHAYGMIASVNLMQTAALPVRTVAAGAKAAAKAGCDWFYIVDSFGSMTPNETKDYTRAVIDESGLVVGLHAHNNSGLAVANCLAAIEAGGRLVDSTLQGIGRATGNPPTEVMVLALQRMGFELDIDTEAVMQLGELARALFAERGTAPLHYVSGAAGVHSRAIPGLQKHAAERGRSFRPFLLRLGNEAKKRELPVRDVFADDFVHEMSETSPAAVTPEPTAAMVSWMAKASRRESTSDVAMQAERVFVSAIRARKTGVIHLVDSASFPFAGPIPWETAELIGVSVPVTGPAPDLGERAPEIVVVDADVTALPNAKRVLRLSFASIMNDAAASLATRVARGGAVQVDGALDGVRAALRVRGVTAVESTSDKRVVVTASLPADLRAGDTIISFAPRAERTALVDRARAMGATVLVPPVAAQVAAQVQAELAISRAADEAVDAIGVLPPIVAPATGEVVVDDPGAPRVVLDGNASFDQLATKRARALMQGRGRL